MLIKKLTPSNINSTVNYNINFTKIVVDIAFPSLLKSITIITEGSVRYRRRKKQKNIVRSNKNEQYSTYLSSQHQKNTRDLVDKSRKDHFFTFYLF